MSKKAKQAKKGAQKAAAVPAKEQRDFSLSSTSPEFFRLMGGYGPSLSGVSVTEHGALTSAAVWRAINLTASTVASLPLKVFKDGPSGFRVEQDKSLFTDPMYPEVTWFEGIETLTASMLLYGNGYGLKIWNEAGTQIARLLPLDPGTVGIRRVDPTDENPSGKLFRLVGLSEELTSFEVMHLPGLSFDGLAGLPVIGYAKETIGAAIAAEQVAAKMFDSGLLTGGILQAEADMSDEQAEQAKQRWREKTSGLVRSYEVALLSAGWKFIPTQIPPEQAQWIESRHFSIAEIARVFGMPPALLFEYGDTGNVEADKLGAQWLRFGLNSLLRRIEHRLSMHLLPRGTFCEFTREGLLQGNPKEQAEIYSLAVDKWMTVNEIRALQNLPPLPGGNEISKPAPPMAPPVKDEPSAAAQEQDDPAGEEPAGDS